MKKLIAPYLFVGIFLLPFFNAHAQAFDKTNKQPGVYKNSGKEKGVVNDSTIMKMAPNDFMLVPVYVMDSVFQYRIAICNLQNQVASSVTIESFATSCNRLSSQISLFCNYLTKESGTRKKLADEHGRADARRYSAEEYAAEIEIYALLYASLLQLKDELTDCNKERLAASLEIFCKETNFFDR